ncbi:MAG: histidine kinase [Bacteroidota bacterium]
MDAAIRRTIRARIYDFFTTRIVYHTLFWAAMLLTLIMLDGSSKGMTFKIVRESLNIGFYGVVVYFNLFYLIPNYLSEKKFLLYCVLLIISVILITPIKIFVFYVLFKSFGEELNILRADQYWYFLASFLIVGSSTVFKIISDWVRYQRDRKDLQTQTMQSELKFLKSQINPHFLFNTLNNLYALTLKKSDKAPEIVIKLSEMMRYMLYECNEKRVLLNKEVNYIRNYLDLERLRQGKNVEINFEVSGQVTTQKIAPLMFIPFLENSFKHGLNNQISHGFVNIFLEVADQQVRMYIENSKPDTLPQQSHKRSGGIGLVNVRRRLNLLYPNQHELTIKDNPKTYGVQLEIELD